MVGGTVYAYASHLAKGTVVTPRLPEPTAKKSECTEKDAIVAVVIFIFLVLLRQEEDRKRGKHRS